ncbi:MAG TPA: hypothetical protein VGP26_28750 [Actinophytocola sp.]|nr:hypothetical protein [Actinophytocola sp.]
MDSLWVSNTLLPSLITAAVLLLVLWPTRHSGRRLLQRWGVAEPTDPQSAEAVRYLRRRRILYVVLFLVLPPVVALMSPAVRNGPGNIVIPLLAAMLIAELIATLRPVSGVRTASLDRRTWRDLVPVWAVLVTAVLAAWTVALVVLAFAAQPWANRYAAEIPPDDEAGPGTRAELLHPTGWLTLGGVALCLVVLVAVVFLAVRRPAVPGAEVDFALRTRTARVSVGIGFLCLAGLVNDAQNRLVFLQGAGRHPQSAPPGWLSENLHQSVEIAGFVTLVGALVCWSWLAIPTRKSPVRTG